MNVYALIIVCALVGEYILSLLSSALNLGSLRTTLPTEFSGVFGEERYAQSQKYTHTRTKFGLVRIPVKLNADSAQRERGFRRR